MTLSAATRTLCGIFIEQFAPGSASTSGRSALITVCGNMCMPFSCSQPPPEHSAVLVLCVGFCAILYTAICCLSRRNDTTTSPTKTLSCSAQSQTVYLSVFQTTSWLILTGDVHAPNAAQQPFFSSLSTIFGSVGFSHAAVFLVAPANRECNSSGISHVASSLTCLRRCFLCRCF